MIDAHVRPYVRAAVAAALAGITAASSIWIDSPALIILAAVLGTLSGYLTIGAATPIEPQLPKPEGRHDDGRERHQLG